MKIQLSKSARVVELGQDQVQVAHSSVQEALVAAGQEQDTILSKKQGRLLQYTTESGAVLVQGDTHAIWGSHNAGSEAFAALTDACNANPGKVFEVEVTSVAFISSVAGGAAAEALSL